MKIHQLPMGARFEYQGQEYVKTGPLFATGSAGQRLIPKHAVLKPLGDTAAPQKPAPTATVPRTDVLAAFDAFCAECGALVPDDRQAALAAARERFLKALDGLRA